MGRVIIDQENTWGKLKGAEPQRSDLWVVDFNLALQGLKNVVLSSASMTSGVATAFVPDKMATYYASAVALPDLRVRGEQVRRDSRPYQTPSWDEGCEAVRILFMLDCLREGKASDPYRSEIYQMLDVWRGVVRAGRGAMSNEYSITLDNNYRIDYAFDVQLSFLRGSSNSPNDLNKATNPGVSFISGGAGGGLDSPMVNDLEFALRLTLVRCWLSSFKLTELSYEGTRVVQIESLFYTDDIRQGVRNTPITTGFGG